MWTIFSNFSVFFLMVLTGTENFNILNVKRNWIDRIIITPPNSLFMNPRCSILTINTVPDRTYLGGDYCRRCHLISFRFFKNTIWTNSFYLWKVYSFNFIDIVFAPPKKGDFGDQSYPLRILRCKTKLALNTCPGLKIYDFGDYREFINNTNGIVTKAGPPP